MRRYLTGALALALSIGVAGGVFAATADQSIDGKVSPKKLPKKKFKKSTIQIMTAAADADDPSAIPPRAIRAKVDLPSNARFKTESAPECTSSLEGTDRATALSLCGKSKVSKDGGSTATVALPLGPGGARTDLPADVMAFNGPKKGKKPTLILWTRIEAVSATTILNGVLKNAKGKAYGKQLDVSIPLIAGGAGALSEFQVKVNKGKYVQARCKAKKMPFRAAFTYTDAPKTKVTDSDRCKRA